jgi:hypothetical protein
VSSEHVSQVSAGNFGGWPVYSQFTYSYGTLSPGSKPLFPVSCRQLPYPLEYYFSLPLDLNENKSTSIIVFWNSIIVFWNSIIEFLDFEYQNIGFRIEFLSLYFCPQWNAIRNTTDFYYCKAFDQ